MMDLPSLPERPKAEILSVGDVLQHAQAGRLRVPHFQTGLRWGAKQVQELFDSIVRGFPIGGLLLWKREAPAEEALTFGPLQFSAPRVPDALYIVDGQQRVTALVGALLHPDDRPLGGTHAVWVDLASGRFEAKRELPPPTWIPVRLLGDRRRLLHWASSADLGGEREGMIDRAFALEEAIIRYTMPAYVVRDADVGALRLIFSRVNNAGVPLREDEVFQALFGSDGDAPKPLEAMAAWLDHETGFGRLPGAWLLRCVKAVGELDARRSFSEQERPSDSLVADTRAALHHAILFLQQSAAFVHASVLPYRFPLIVLARFFHLHPQPHPRSRELLTRWVWRGALSGTHGNSSQAAVGAHLGDVGEDEHATVQRLLARTPREVDLPDPHTRWYGQAAASRLYATALLSLDPLHPATDTPSTPTSVAASLSAHDLGDLFRTVTATPRPEIAARVLIPPKFPRHRLTDASDEALRSLGIDEAAALALRSRDDDAFITHRAAFLRTELDRVVRRLAAPGANDRPPITILLAAR